MTDTQSLKEDIAYVRAAAERSVCVHIPAIYLLWAVLCLCGFALVDFVGPESWRIGMYWLIAAPTGMCLSWWLGSRANFRAGQADRRWGNRWMLHYLGFMATGMLGFGLVAADQMTWTGLSSLWILLLGLTYFLAGLHLQRRLLPVGVLLGVGYLLTLFLPGYKFTTVGVLVAAALTAQAFLGARDQRATN